MVLYKHRKEEEITSKGECMIKLFTKETPEGKKFESSETNEVVNELVWWAYQNCYIDRDEYLRAYYSEWISEAEAAALVEKRTGGLIEFY